jgi:hypothetical protein
LSDMLSCRLSLFLDWNGEESMFHTLMANGPPLKRVDDDQ